MNYTTERVICSIQTTNSRMYGKIVQQLKNGGWDSLNNDFREAKPETITWNSMHSSRFCVNLSWDDVYLSDIEFIYTAPPPGAEPPVGNVRISVGDQYFVHHYGSVLCLLQRQRAVDAWNTTIGPRFFTIRNLCERAGMTRHDALKVAAECCILEHGNELFWLLSMRGNIQARVLKNGDVWYTIKDAIDGGSRMEQISVFVPSLGAYGTITIGHMNGKKIEIVSNDPPPFPLPNALVAPPSLPVLTASVVALRNLEPSGQLAERIEQSGRSGCHFSNLVDYFQTPDVRYARGIGLNEVIVRSFSGILADYVIAVLPLQPAKFEVYLDNMLLASWDAEECILDGEPRYTYVFPLLERAPDQYLNTGSPQLERVPDDSWTPRECLKWRSPNLVLPRWIPSSDCDFSIHTFFDPNALARTLPVELQDTFEFYIHTYNVQMSDNYHTCYLISP